MIECPVTQCRNNTPDGQVCERCLRELTVDLRLAEPQRPPTIAAPGHKYHPRDTALPEADRRIIEDWPAGTNGKRHQHWEDSADYWQGIEKELQLTVTRQASKTPQPGGRSTDVAVPYNIAASNAHHLLRLAVRHEAAIVATTDELEAMSAAVTIAECSRILTNHITELGAAAVAGLRGAFRQAINSLDARTARIYAGPCPDCHRDLYTHAGGDEAECRTCDAKHQGVQAWRNGKVEAARHEPMTRGEILVALPAVFAIALPAKTFDSWVHRRKLTAVYQVNLVKGYRLPARYTVADVETLMLEQATREEQRSVR